MRSAFRTLLAEPRAPNPPRRVWRDWALLALVNVVAILEIALRDDVAQPVIAFPVAVILSFTLLWRRTHPLATVAIAFGTFAVIDVVAIISGTPPVGLDSSAFVLVLPYTLFRWGAGREVAAGFIPILVVLILANLADFTDLGLAIAGATILMFPAVLGATVRFRVSSRSREVDQIRLTEREHLARELHDTVAHHMSAIAIQAQAGQTLGGSDPEAALKALRVVEHEASRALAEMRSMVGVLRESDEADLSPQRRVADIERLARRSDGEPSVDVELSGDLEDLGPSLEAALFRLAQESITNAARHARNATKVSVLVSGDPETVRLRVTDDGDVVAPGRYPSGYGIVGMAERAKLLGGTIHAGPGPQKGWIVSAELPRQDAGR